MIKRIFDVVCAALGLGVFSPLLLIVAFWIKLDSSGPVFYRGVRVGKDGKLFRIFKFRSMVVDAEKKGASSTADDDSRITRSGRVLRRYKLDELPQLLNVVKGEMSLVGPRPQVSWAVALYNEAEKKLLSVRPGITDWASLRFPNEGEILKGSIDPDREYLEKIAPEKIRLGLEYVKQHSLLVDCKIIFKTVKALLYK